MKVLLNKDYVHLEQYVRHLPEVFEQEGQTIYTGRNHIKVMTAPDGTLVNVKQFHAPRGINSLVYSLGIRKPKGQRAFEYTEILKAKGICTPEAIAYIERRRMGLLVECYLVTVQCPYEHTMYEVGNAPAGTYEELALALARFTARMHDRQVLHKDFSPGNILWSRQGNDFHFAIVDINRMRFGQVSMRQGCANLKRLWGPKRFFLMVADEYARQRGLSPDEVRDIALAKRAAFWKRYGRKHPIKFQLEL